MAEVSGNSLRGSSEIPQQVPANSPVKPQTTSWAQQALDFITGKAPEPRSTSINLTQVEELPPPAQIAAKKVNKHRPGYHPRSLWETLRTKVLQPLALIPGTTSSVPYAGVSLGILTTPIFAGADRVLQEIIHITHTKATAQSQNDNRELWKERTIDSGRVLERVESEAVDSRGKTYKKVDLVEGGEVLAEYIKTLEDAFTTPIRENVTLASLRNHLADQTDEGKKALGEKVLATLEATAGKRRAFKKMELVAALAQIEPKYAQEAENTRISEPLKNRRDTRIEQISADDCKELRDLFGMEFNSNEFNIKDLEESLEVRQNDPAEKILGGKFLASIKTKTDEVGVTHENKVITKGELIARYADHTIAMSQSARAALLTLHETKMKSMGDLISMQLAGKKMSFRLSLTAAALWLAMNALHLAITPIAADAFTGVGYAIAGVGFVMSTLGILMLAYKKPQTFAAYAQGAFVLRGATEPMLKLLKFGVEKANKHIEKLQNIQARTPLENRQLEMLLTLEDRLSNAGTKVQQWHTKATDKIARGGMRDHLREVGLNKIPQRKNAIHRPSGNVDAEGNPTGLEADKIPNKGVNQTLEVNKMKQVAGGEYVKYSTPVAEASYNEQNLLKEISQISAQGWDSELEEILARCGVEIPTDKQMSKAARTVAIEKSLMRFMGADSSVIDDINNQQLKKRRDSHRETLSAVLFATPELRAEALKTLAKRGVVIDKAQLQKADAHPNKQRALIEKIRRQIKKAQPEPADRNATFRELKTQSPS